MSFVFIPQHQKPQNSPNIRETVQKMLDENSQLLQIIHESQLRGKIHDCIEYQKVLHRNIVYLGKLADSNTDEHASLSALGNQLGSGLLHEGNHLQSSAQCGSIDQMSNQEYSQQQGNFPVQGQQMINQQSIIPHNQSLMSQSTATEMSQGSIEQITNQQPVMTQKHSAMSCHPTGMVQSSASGAVSSASDYGTITHTVGQQGGYCSAQTGLEYNNQHGYMQLKDYSQQQYNEQQQQQINEQQQYSQSGLVSATKHGQYMADQQNQISSQLYIPNWQHGRMNSEGIIRQGNMQA